VREGAGHAVEGRHTRWPWCSELWHGCHALPLWGISPSTWHMPKWPAWGAILGRFWADLGLGPKIKVEAREQLYTFCLEVKVTRALGQ
jgi:hypothetical protein